jgi:hypothetical protein
MHMRMQGRETRSSSEIIASAMLQKTNQKSNQNRHCLIIVIGKKASAA